MTKRLTHTNQKIQSGQRNFMNVTEFFNNWLEKNSKILLYLAVIAITVAVLITGWKWFENSKEQKAQGALYEVESKIQKIQLGLLKKKSETKSDQEMTKMGSSENQSKIIEKDFGPLLNELNSLIGKYNRSKAALSASMYLASIYMDYRLFDKAFAVLNEASSNMKKNDILTGLLQAQLAISMMALDKYNDAKRIYENLINDKNLNFLHAEALLKLGMIEEKLGNATESKNHYRRASQEFGNTESGKIAKGYLRLLELRK